MPEHGRVLGASHRDVHDSRQHLHARVRILRGAERETTRAARGRRAVREVRSALPEARVEVLTPDFCGDLDAVARVLDAGPHVFNHNMETVPRLYRRVRKGAVYERSLELLRRARKNSQELSTKTGMMLGLGETRDEVLQAMDEIAAQGTHILTLGQYLQPTPEHLPIERYVHPDEFAEFKQLGEQMGFQHVEAGPLVRSSYHAFEQEEAARR